MTEDTRSNLWTRAFCWGGFLLILTGAIPSFLAVNPELPWFALIILGIVAFTFGLTFEDAQENDQGPANPSPQTSNGEAE
ncbi:MAG: hypothetical protein P1V97_16705 [Planctomycetota bacterium]|nr:hypothetical protein [Planctomycetota bacterium]